MNPKSQYAIDWSLLNVTENTFIQEGNLRENGKCLMSKLKCQMTNGKELFGCISLIG